MGQIITRCISREYGVRMIETYQWYRKILKLDKMKSKRTGNHGKRKIIHIRMAKIRRS